MANSVFKIIISAHLEWVLIPHRALELFFDFRIFDSAPLEWTFIPLRALEVNEKGTPAPRSWSLRFIQHLVVESNTASW